MLFWLTFARKAPRRDALLPGLRYLLGGVVDDVAHFTR
jgi:hypothetical protein